MCNAYNHPPGCTCGWGGEGHLGGGHSYGNYTPLDTRWSWASEDFTRPTRCPKCTADVFFIRHNGGSVWVDELGWPWPKHACFDKPNEPTTRFGHWSAKGSRLRNPHLGIVIRVTASSLHPEPTVEIRLNDNTRWSLVPRYVPAVASLAGSLVMLSRENNIVILPEYGEVPYHSLSELPSSPNAWVKCPHCKASVQAANYAGHYDYCLKHYVPNQPKPPAKPNPMLARIQSKRASASNQPQRNARPAAPNTPPRVRHPLPPKPKPRPVTIDLPPSVESTQFLQQLSGAADAKAHRITAEVERIAKDAWSHAGESGQPTSGLKLAQHHAIQSAQCLSPKIRREVSSRLQKNNWEVLMAFKPT